MSNTALIQRPEALAKIESLNDLQTLGQVFVKSKFFSDATDAAQAIVKVMAGAELGFPPIASMTGVYIVKGKVSLSANLIAAAIKKSGKYNFRVRQLSNEACKIEFFEAGESIGFSEFTIKEGQAAGLTENPTWKKFPRNMLYARAMSNGAKWYCPDIFGGPIYTPDELGATIDGETGEMIELPAEPTRAPEPVAAKPANGNSGKLSPEKPVRMLTSEEELADEFYKRGRAAGIAIEDLRQTASQVAGGAMTWTEAIESLPEV